MPLSSPRDFLQVARHRLDGADDILRRTTRTLEAYYLGGYSIECSLKALILEKTPEPDFVEQFDKLTKGAKHHRYDVLLDRLRDLQIELTDELSRRLRRFDWSTDLRYETGRKDGGETRGMLTTASMVLQWVEQQFT